MAKSSELQLNPVQLITSLARSRKMPRSKVNETIRLYQDTYPEDVENLVSLIHDGELRIDERK